MGQGGGKGVFLFLALVAAIAIVAFAGCGGGGGGDNAHVNEDTGSTNDLPLDEREGTPPPPAKETDLIKAAEKAECFLILKLNGEGNEELPPNSPSPEYEADIPSSGPHVEPPNQQADGAYMLMPEPIDFVGSLDNGRVEIQYSPDMDEEIQLAVKGLYDTMYGGTLLFPNEDMGFAVAATAWRAELGCTTWQGETTLDAVRAFARGTWGKYGNEPIDAFPPSGPTPKDPAEPDAG
jgi:hypothetical protein